MVVGQGDEGEEVVEEEGATGAASQELEQEGCGVTQCWVDSMWVFESISCLLLTRLSAYADLVYWKMSSVGNWLLM